MKLYGGNIMSNTINWFQSNRFYSLLTQSLLETEKDINESTRKFKEKEQDYYAGKLTPEEEAEMIAFLELYVDNEHSPEELE